MAVRHSITKFKNLTVALEEIEPFVRDPRHLLTGKPLAKFGDARPRELLANWLICAVMNSSEAQERYTFTSDPTGGDGIILDTMEGKTWPTEHVMVPPDKGSSGKSTEERILDAVHRKNAKGGLAYASGKTLVVFLEDAKSTWHPNRVARALPDPLHFDAVWVVGLSKLADGSYVYGVSSLDHIAGDASVFDVTIVDSFDSWHVKCIQ